MQITGLEMKQLRKNMFSFPHGDGFESLLRRLSKKFIIEDFSHEVTQRAYYDTFDWRLHRANQVFFSSGGALHLEQFNGQGLAVAAGRRRSKFFWWNIEEGELVERLKEIIEMRALCPVIELSTEATQFRIMNKDRKTVARLAVRNDRLSEQTSELPELIIVHEIRGYEREFDGIVEQCLKRRCSEVKNKRLFDRLLSNSDLTPRDYGAKFRVDLDRDISIGGAVSRLCLHLVEDMQKNHAGVIADIDSEFLHDFRIAVRRTRSLLSLLKKILPEAQCRYFQEEFRWLGTVTGPLRDIDVYLLEKDKYLNMLPAELQDGMSSFFEQLEVRRNGELRELQSHLGSERFGNLITDWKGFLTDPDSELFKGSRAQNCRDYVDQMIVKRFKSFIRDGDRISDASADDELHKLRIKGKKFRYLLEFFKSFYDEKQMSSFLKFMKKLQDNLGDFNDLSVQQTMLGAELGGLKAKNLQTIRFAAALGGLIAVLSDRHRAVRNEFESTYADFTRPEIKKLLRVMVNGSL